MKNNYLYGSKTIFMDHTKILKALVAIVMTAVLAILIMLIVAHIRNGLATSNSKLMLAAYILMSVYALYRLYINIKGILKK